MRPPSGLGVEAVIPASASAFEFTSVVCPVTAAEMAIVEIAGLLIAAFDIVDVPLVQPGA